MNDQRARRGLDRIAAGASLALIGFAAWLGRNGPPAPTPVVTVVPAVVSYPAPALALNDIDGSAVSLKDYGGQVVLVNLWATWCEPCKQEMPALEVFHRRHASAGFAVVAVNEGEAVEVVTDFVESYALTFPVWLDPESIATRSAFQSFNLPSSYVIDRQGVVRLRWAGAIELAALERSVAPLLLE